MGGDVPGGVCHVVGAHAHGDEELVDGHGRVDGDFAAEEMLRGTRDYCARGVVAD